MTPAFAREMLNGMLQDYADKGKCPQCGATEGVDHLRNCIWKTQADKLAAVADSEPPALPLDGPNLCWGDPCGTYEIACTNNQWRFIHRLRTPSGPMEFCIPFSVQALAEMQAMLNMIQFDFQVEVPNGRVLGHA